jgi:Bifunctional DNA primase/polymerase, N-terminal
VIPSRPSARPSARPPETRPPETRPWETRRSEPDPGRLLFVALRLARAGHPVLPCVPGAKTPLTRHGFLDATTDERRIRAWWRRTPTANLAVATGSGSYDVLDVDVRETGSGFPAFQRLVAAGLLDGLLYLVATPSGGLHAYFPGSGRAGSSRPRHHLDLKAGGGYVLTPPSVVGGRPYRVVHRADGPHRELDWDAVTTLLDPRDRPRRRHRPDRDLAALVRWVADRPEGERNTATFWAACRAVEQGVTDLRPLIEAAVAAGLPPDEAARTVRSARRRAL